MRVPLRKTLSWQPVKAINRLQCKCGNYLLEVVQRTPRRSGGKNQSIVVAICPKCGMESQKRIKLGSPGR